MSASFQSLRLTSCVVWAQNPRRTVGDLTELVESVRSVGVLEPVLARPAGDGWEILAGQRRFLAAGLAGLTEIPALVRDVPDDVALEIALVENSARCDVLPLEEAEAIERLVRDHGRGVADVSARLGRSVRWVERRRMLLNLTAESRAWCERLHLPLAHMESLSAVGTETQARVIARLGYVREPHGVPAHARFAQEITYELHILAGAPFEPDDAKLGGRGPCVGCVYRSDRQGDLFGTIPSGAHCLDRACWDAKVGGLWARTEKEAKRKKLAVLPLGEVSYGGYGQGLCLRPDVPYVTEAPTKDAKPVAVVRGQRGHVYELYAKPVETDEDEGADPDDEDGDTPAGRRRKAEEDAADERRRAERAETEAAAARFRKIFELAQHPTHRAEIARVALHSLLVDYDETPAVRLAQSLGRDVAGATRRDIEPIVNAFAAGEVPHVLVAMLALIQLESEPEERTAYEQAVIDLLDAPEQPVEPAGVTLHEGETAPAEEAAAAGIPLVTLRVKRSVWLQHRSGLQDSAKGLLHKAWQPEGEDRFALCARGGDAHTKVMAYAQAYGLDVRVGVE